MRKINLILIVFVAFYFNKAYSQIDSFNIYPNPFTSSAKIHFYINQHDTGSLVFYNLLGQVVGVNFQDTLLSAGSYTFTFGDTFPNGIYLVMLKVGSIKKSSKVFKTSPTSYINKKDLVKNDISVFPNPTNGEANIQISNFQNKNVKLNIFDNTGKQIFTDYISGSIFKFKMDGFDSGIYTINIPDLNYNYKLILIK